MTTSPLASVLRYASIIILTTILLIACKKDHYSSDEPDGPDGTAEFVRSWLTKQKKDSVAVRRMQTQLLWDKAFSFRADSEKIYKIVPLLDTNTVKFEIGKGIRRLLVLKTVKDSVFQGYIYELFGNKQELSDQERSLVAGFDQRTIKGFTGNLVKYNLRNSFDESAKYESGIVIERMKIRQKAAAKAKIAELSKKNPNVMYCEDWYMFYYVNEVLVGATYLYSVCTCEAQSMSIRDSKGNFKVVFDGCGGGIAEGGGNPGNGGSNNDCKYIIQSIREGKRVMEVYNPCNPQPPQDTTVLDRLRNNPKALCILLGLKGNSTFSMLVSEFNSGGSYSLKFNLADLGSQYSGQTVFDKNYVDKNVYINLDEQGVNSRFAYEVARTYIHEAYHAYIAQILIQHGGPYGIGPWTGMSTQDYDKPLDQIFDAYVQYGLNQESTKAATNGQAFDDNAAQHQIISQNIDRIAMGVKEFVEAQYPAVKTTPGISMDNYRAVAWVGLEKTQAFKNTWGDENNQTYINRKNAIKSYTSYDCH